MFDRKRKGNTQKHKYTKIMNLKGNTNMSKQNINSLNKKYFKMLIMTATKLPMHESKNESSCFTILVSGVIYIGLFPFRTGASRC